MSRRGTWLGLAMVAACVAPAAAHPSGIQWRWYVIDKYTYNTATSGMEATLVTGPILEWPAENKSIFFQDRTTVPKEFRLRVLITGPARGTKVPIAATRKCSNELDTGAATTMSSDKDYSLVIKSGQTTLLPAAVESLHDGVSCAWSLDLTIPGTRHATVTVSSLGYQTSAHGWMLFTGPAGGAPYDREACTLSVSGGSTQRSCTRINTA